MMRIQVGKVGPELAGVTMSECREVAALLVLAARRDSSLPRCIEYVRSTYGALERARFGEHAHAR